MLSLEGRNLIPRTLKIKDHTKPDQALGGMCQCLNQNKSAEPAVILQMIKEDVERFVGDAPQFDDITMLCLDYKG